MLDHRFLRENLDECARRLKIRDPEIDLTPFTEMDQKRRDLLQEEETLKQKRNQVSQGNCPGKKRGKKRRGTNIRNAKSCFPNKRTGRGKKRR